MNNKCNIEEYSESEGFQLIVFNIHQWKTGGFDSNSEEVGKYFKKMNADFICLNEVLDDGGFSSFGSRFEDESTLAKVAKETHGYDFYFNNASWGFGNAIMSKLKIQSSSSVGSIINNHENRNVIRAEVEIIKMENKQKVQIFCLHTDHMKEGVRVGQVKDFFNKCMNLHSQYPQIVCGDFNAIRKDDYSEEYFTWLENFRRKKRWEPPHEFVTNFMIEKKYIDAWKLLNPRVINKDVVTSRKIDTRIDFIFVNELFLEKFEILKCFIDRSATMSDHFPVVLNFDFKK